MKTVFKFQFLDKIFKQAIFKLLDIGAGNNSAKKTKLNFPNCEYYGVDISKDYNNADDNFSLMKDFYELDLTKLAYENIPENHFDYIQMAHIIEHLYNGDEVIKHLIPKLKIGGYIYIEYPGIKSTKLPSMHGTLNFYDDASHVRIYSVREIEALLLNNNFEIVKSGTRRNWIYIFAMPARIIVSLLKTGKLEGNHFWDILGFAEYIFAQKK
jgi:trans-aconitate methyltransferase